jgi:hypothetical protein
MDSSHDFLLSSKSHKAESFVIAIFGLWELNLSDFAEFSHKASDLGLFNFFVQAPDKHSISKVYLVDWCLFKTLVLDNNWIILIFVHPVRILSSFDFFSLKVEQV